MLAVTLLTNSAHVNSRTLLRGKKCQPSHVNAPSCPTAAVAVDEVSHQECVLLNRVLSDKAKLPPVCRPPHVNMESVAALQKTAKSQQEGGGIGGLVRRLTGAVPGAFNSISPPHDSKKGGCVLFYFVWLVCCS